MSDIDHEIQHAQGLPDALVVARGGDRPVLNDGVAKVLGLMLRHGECDAWVRAPHIEIRFSWLDRRKPSTYFGNLAPGMIAELMNFGKIKSIEEEATFSLEPGECRSGLYHFTFTKKWVFIRLESDEIAIRVRSEKSGIARAIKALGD